ncbi:RING finger and SPRY domain-containing protein 1 [Tyrophagus putrescentiae]|nr:RING finger and SPRY domain-containing protein 1 [Tyrophagus putrescentiae]
MAHDIWTVASCGDVHLNVISTFPILQHVYFYEVEVLNCPERVLTAQQQQQQQAQEPVLLLGWISRLSCLPESPGSFVKGSPFSAFYSLEQAAAVSPGEVIGCLANVEESTVRFYRNGRKTEEHVNHEIFSYLPLFAYVRLLPPEDELTKLTLRLNFGDRPFAFPPTEPFFTFQENNPDQDSACSALPRRKLRDHWKWSRCRRWSGSNSASRFLHFEYSEAKAKEISFPPPFQDRLQRRIGQVVAHMEAMLGEKLTAERAEVHKPSFKNNANDLYLVVEVIAQQLLSNLDPKGLDPLRFLQAVVERFGRKTRRQALINRAFPALFLLLDRMRKQFSGKDRCLHPVLLHYLTTSLRLDSAADQRRIVNFCLFQVRFTKRSYGVSCGLDFSICCQAVERKRNFFLFQALLRCTDPLTQLYAFTVLKQSGFDFVRYPLHNARSRFPPLADVRANLEDSSPHEPSLPAAGETSEGGSSPSSGSSSSAQSSTPFPSADASFFQLNPEDRSNAAELLLSPSHLMARNDSFQFQTVRSKFAINPGTFYFEVTLLTAGVMRIGLATRLMDIERCEAVGDDALSVGLDGFHRVVCPPWKVGDVVGVYFDSARNTVLFGLNQVVIELAESPFQLVELDQEGNQGFIFSVLPCHVAVSLGLMQQCHFNFRCTVIPEAFLQKIGELDNNFFGSGRQTVNITSSMVLCGATNRMGNFSVAPRNELPAVKSPHLCQTTAAA